ncbi:MAG: type II toxin-antitoxin system ParD family antitoxin [Ancrocorticia sp.]
MATMNISLSDDLREFVENEVRQGAFTSSSEYVRQLLREKRDEAILRDKILEGFASGRSERNHDELFEELRRVANGG